MARIQPPTAPPDRSRDLLAELTGRAGPMVSTMAHSPALLQGYLGLSRAIKRVALPRALSEKISLAVQEWIGCDLCLAAHTEAGLRAGLSEADVALARQGLSTDDRETALIELAVRLLAEPSSITDDDVAGVRARGWSDRVLADVVGLVALNNLTGSFNLLAGLSAKADAHP